jgi:hypothetical protein
MSARVYLLLNVVNGKSEEVVRNLSGKAGVVVADALEGPPDVMMVVEASDRQKLAELSIQAFASVEAMVEGMQLLPTREG